MCENKSTRIGLFESIATCLFFTTQGLALATPNSGLAVGGDWCCPAVACLSECRAALEKKAGVIVI
jgi:hypothetical protein